MARRDMVYMDDRVEEAHVHNLECCKYGREYFISSGDRKGLRQKHFVHGNFDHVTKSVGRNQIRELKVELLAFNPEDRMISSPLFTRIL